MSQDKQEYRLPSPINNPENTVFLEAAQNNQLVLKHCNACKVAVSYTHLTLPTNREV